MAVTKAKTFEIIRATGSRLKPGDVLEVDGHKVKINKQGVAAVPDAGLQRALLAKYGKKAGGAHGGQILSAELEAYNEHRHADPVRRTHYWTMPEMPWKKKGVKRGKGQRKA